MLLAITPYIAYLDRSPPLLDFGKKKLAFGVPEG
jgi:hypothetical protein